MDTENNKAEKPVKRLAYLLLALNAAALLFLITYLSTTGKSVIPIEPISLTIKGDETTVPVGGSIRFVADIYPINAVDADVTWDTTNFRVATVDDTGTVTGMHSGETYLVARLSNGLEKKVKITVLYEGDDGEEPDIPHTVKKDDSPTLDVVVE